MAQSNIEIQMVKFRPNGSGFCLVEMVPNGGFSGTPPSDTHLTIPTSYKITMKRRESPHKCRFSITTSTHAPDDEKNDKYCLVGVYFIRDQLTNGRTVGQHFIEKVECNIAASPPTLTVHLDREAIENPEEFEFNLLVQRIRDGALGIIDPEWENE